MKTHLSQDEILGFIAGDTPGAEAREHLLHCRECAAEAAGFAATLSQFRRSATEWAGQTAVPRLERPVAPAAPARRGPWRLAIPALAFAALAALAVGLIPAYRERSAKLETEMAAQDAALMTQVDQQISRAVPETMEPLITLVSWGPGNSARQ